MISYAVKLEVEEDGVNVTFRDFDDVFTCGETIPHALEMAEDVLNLMIEQYLEDGKELPEPSKLMQGEYLIKSKFEK